MLIIHNVGVLVIDFGSNLVSPNTYCVTERFLSNISCLLGNPEMKSNDPFLCMELLINLSASYFCKLLMFDEANPQKRAFKSLSKS